MKNRRSQLLLLLSKKKLNIIDSIILHELLLKLSSDDDTEIKLFLDNYYNIETMPTEFYKMFLYCIQSNNFKQLFDILLRKNIYDLIIFLKCNENKDINLSDLIKPIDFFKIPYKHIKIIIDFIKKIDLYNDDLSLKKYNINNIQWLLRKPYISNETEITKIAIKIYLSIGLNNAIELLSCKYGLVDYDIIYFMFNNINTKTINDKNISAFQEFLFGNKKNANNNIRLILAGNFNELFVNFDYFFNSIDYFIDKLGTKLNKSKVSILLKEKYIAPIIDSPEISGDILQDMISSYYHKYGISDSEKEIIGKNIKAYNEKLKTKTKSSILKVNIPQIGNYKVEMIPLNDARNLVMGYRAGNCFRINGDAFVLFNIFLTNPHMRLISISTNEYKDFGMILLMRNGNVLIAQGIETSKHIPNYIIGEKLYIAVKMAIESIIEEMNCQSDEIVASIIGLSNSNTTLYNHNILPFIINPLLENDHQFYNGIDCYQGLLSIKKGKTLQDIKLFIPNKFYSDSFEQIFRRNKTTYNSYNYREIEKILNSLRYEKFKTESRETMLSYYSELVGKIEDYTICTYDWFITVFQDGTLDTFINSNVPEIIKKYELELNKIRRTSNIKRKILGKNNK